MPRTPLSLAAITLATLVGAQSAPAQVIPQKEQTSQIELEWAALVASDQTLQAQINHVKDALIVVLGENTNLKGKLAKTSEERDWWQKYAEGLEAKPAVAEAAQPPK